MSNSRSKAGARAAVVAFRRRTREPAVLAWENEGGALVAGRRGSRKGTAVDRVLEAKQAAGTLPDPTC